MDWYTIITTIIGLITFSLGVIFTFFITNRYYQKASKELKIESSELRRLTSLLLHAMDYNGWIKLQRDSKGNIIGFIQTITGVGGIESEEKFGTPSIIAHDKSSSEATVIVENTIRKKDD